MALSIDLSPVQDFVEKLSGEASLVEWLWQVGVGATAIVLGYFAAHIVCREVRTKGRWQFGKGDFERVAFPIFTFGFLALGKMMLARYQSVVLLEILQTVVTATIIIRLAVYVLGHILPQGTALKRLIKIIAWIAWIAVLLQVTGLLPEVIDALDDIGVTVGKGKQRITVWLMLQALAALALTITLAMWIARITETRVMGSESMEMTTRVVITKVVRMGTLVIAILIALPMVGIDVTTLSIFGGALGVGLGFGLQKIASNYVSGFIVLLDRSLRIGDVVTVDNKRGEVKAIESRFTVIKGADGVESIIPNEKLITESVNHHTYSDPKISLVQSVWISYESDVELACALLAEIARRQSRVIEEPAASARVKQLGEHGIELELTVWIGDPAVGEGDLKSSLFKDILRTFKSNGIEIPYPRRDVRMIATAATPKAPDSSGT
jgi:small-conductance mechanosensitive channel